MMFQNKNMSEVQNYKKSKIQHSVSRKVWDTMESFKDLHLWYMVYVLSMLSTQFQL